MDREVRILGNQSMDAIRIVRRKPFETEGRNGDLAMGTTSKGAVLYGKYNNKWYSFSSKIEGRPSVPTRKSLNGIFVGSLMNGFGPYLPFGTYDTSLNPTYWSDVSDNRYQFLFIMPKRGYVRRILSRVPNALGSEAPTAYIYGYKDGSDMPSDSSTYLVDSASVSFNEADKVYVFTLNQDLYIKQNDCLFVYINLPDGEGSNRRWTHFVQIEYYE